jgi:hypothetical protein
VADRDREELRPLHLEGVPALGEALGRERLRRAAARDLEELRERAVGVDLRRMRSAPSFCWTCTAVAGMGLSPLTVARMIMSRSATVRPAASMADRPAAAAMSLVTWPGPATWRRSMPVCCRIQPSVVATRASISAFVTTVGGT